MPTENVSVIDPGGGGDYTTIAAWEAATDNDLVSADVIEIGELVTGNHSTSGSSIVFGVSTTDATRYRVLRAAAGAEYDPITDTGAKVVHTGNGYALWVDEEGFRMENFGVSWTTATPTASNAAIIWTDDATNANNTPSIVSGVTVLMNCSNGTTLSAMRSINADYPLVIRNCVLVGDGAAGNMAYGIRTVTNPAGSAIQNCVVYGAGVDGIRTDQNTATSVVNNVVVSSGTNDFNYAGGTSNLTRATNASSDATATGTGAITSIVAADEFVDPANNDFRLKGTGQLFGAGTDLSADFPTDIAGDTWGPWSIGAYRATSLEVWSNGAWGPADPLTGVNQGRVTYYRWTKIQAQNADSDPIPTAGATRVLAYLGTVTSGSGASDGLRINPLPYAKASATLEPDLPVAAGKRHIAGVVNTSTAASNKAAVCLAPSGAASIYLRNLDTTSSPIIDIVIEVHR